MEGASPDALSSFDEPHARPPEQIALEELAGTDPGIDPSGSLRLDVIRIERQAKRPRWHWAAGALFVLLGLVAAAIYAGRSTTGPAHTPWHSRPPAVHASPLREPAQQPRMRAAPRRRSRRDGSHARRGARRRDVTRGHLVDTPSPSGTLRPVGSGRASSNVERQASVPGREFGFEK